ncbi:conserved hypothetical protein [Coccidioides posadasii str. Silveira]|uniref:Uncharacterized protein n=1 Tax=Coccidioides posadasii (strain RMSCC 757 / Silveira) TaxID=443226 RepID=E9D463_COCPS|nr:conserved hypothetical protein [Coccidioides posadasii str. Silveira]
MRWGLSTAEIAICLVAPRCIPRHLLAKLQNLEGSAEGKCDPCEASPGIPKKDRDIPMNEKPARAHQKRQEVSALIICYIHG